jgi:quercetin dioxygenase-like cupin family protein
MTSASIRLVNCLGGQINIIRSVRPELVLRRALSTVQREQHEKDVVSMSPSQTENIKEATLRPHQPGQDVFRAILPEEIDWKPFPAFPPSARLAILVGQPSQAGPYTIRVKVPGGVKLMPHKHPEDRIYTVISGIFYIGVGDQFDTEKLHAYPPGAAIILPGNTSHFHWAKSGEYITQVTAIGPLGLEYLNSEDDPRNAPSGM